MGMQPNRIIGDFIVNRTKKLGGFEVWSKQKPERKCYFNDKEMITLMRWMKGVLNLNNINM